MEVKGLFCSSRLLLLHACLPFMSYTHLPTPHTQSSRSSLYTPPVIIHPHSYTSAWSHDHRDDAGGKRSQDSKQIASQATYFLHRNPARRELRRLLGGGGHGGIRATRTGSAPRCPGIGEIDWFSDGPIRKRSRASVWGCPRLQRGCRGKRTQVCRTPGLGVLLDSGFWAKSPLPS